MPENLHLYSRGQIDTEANDSLGKIAKRIEPGSHVLDVGCATGSLGSYLKKYGCIVDGIEYNTESAALARPFYRKIWLGDLEKDSLDKLVNENKYQYIVLADVLEHLRDPGKLLRTLTHAMLPNGRFLISIPNVSHMGVILELLNGDFRYRQEGLLDQTHLRFFTQKSMTRLLNENQLTAKVIDCTILDIQHTEFYKNTAEAIQLNVAETLRKNKNNIVYQFIFEATNNIKGNILPSENVAINPPIGPRIFSTLYFSDSGIEFSEEKSQTLATPLGKSRHKIIYAYPKGSAKVLRFDPSDQKTIILLHSIKLFNLENLIWSFDGKISSINSAPHSSIRFSKESLEPENKTIKMLCENNDPYFYVPAEQEIVYSSDTLEVEISTPFFSIDQNHNREDELGFNLLSSLQQKNQIITLLETQIKSAKVNLAYTSNELVHILGLRSWRISKPLRDTAKILRTTKNFFSFSAQGKNTRYNLARDIIKTAPIPHKVKLKVSPYIKRMLNNQYRKNYTAWIYKYDKITKNDRNAIYQDISRWESNPKISILMPTYNSAEKFLKKAIESVRNQLYKNWELCIADDASTTTHIKKLLKNYADTDDRIKIIFRMENGHISEATNSAFSMASGEYIALLDHDDELAEHALYWVAHEIISHPDAALIYSDEDKIDPSGRRSSPYFKPDWNPDLLLCQNYINHLCIYKKNIVEEIGGFRVGFEGSQDWDLALRFTKNLAPERIRHIPAVLYHWRIVTGSTAGKVDAKPYVVDAARKALVEHCGNSKELVEFGEACNGIFHLPHFKPQNDPLVSIIIPTRNCYIDLKTCIESLGKTTYTNYEVIIIDNQSDELQTLDYFHQLRQDSRFRILSYPHIFNYASMHNWAVPQAKGEYICLLNNDTEIITPEWLEEMLGQAQRPSIGAVGAKLLYADNSLQHGGVITGIGGIAGHTHKYYPSSEPGYFGRAALAQNFSAVTGACLLVSKAHWLQLCGMSLELPVAFNDVDFCLRLEEIGLRNVWLPQAVLYHHESKSRGSDVAPEKIKRFALEHAYMQWRWGHRITQDPAYNPNLALEHENFELAWPPRLNKPWKPNSYSVSIPYGIASLPMQFINVATHHKPIKGSFLVPRGLDDAQLIGLIILIGTHYGRSNGVLTIVLADNKAHNIVAEQSLIGALDNMPLTFYFEKQSISLNGVTEFNFQITVRENTESVTLGSYSLNEQWGHHIAGYEECALRIDLLITNE